MDEKHMDDRGGRMSGLSWVVSVGLQIALRGIVALARSAA